MNNRNKLLDYLKCFSIILMIFGHCITNGSGAEFRANSLAQGNPLYVYIYTFHMPIFMMVSGYLFGKGIHKKTVVDIVKSRIKTVLIPIIVWQILYTTSNIITAIINGANMGIASIAKNYVKGIVFSYRNMWFLWAILGCTVLVSLIHFIFKDNILVSVLSVVLTWLISFKHVQLWLAFYPCFLIAYHFALNEEKFKSLVKLKDKWYVVCVLFTMQIFLLLLLWNPKYYPYVDGDNCLNIIYLFADGKYIHNMYVSILRVVIGVVGTLAWATLFSKILNHIHIKIIDNTVYKISKYSMGFYILSVYFLNTILRGMTDLKPNFLLWILFTIVISIICYVFFSIVDKNKITRMLLLGGR